MNKFIKIVIILAITILFVACNDDNFVEKGSVQVKTSSYYEKEFDYLNGTEKINMQIEKNSKVNVKYSIEVEEGKLEISIEDENGNIVGIMNESGTLTFDTENKKYYLSINAKETKGIFIIDWDNN